VEACHINAHPKGYDGQQALYCVQPALKFCEPTVDGVQFHPQEDVFITEKKITWGKKRGGMHIHRLSIGQMAFEAMGRTGCAGLFPGKGGRSKG
jgi:hypothetical protein